MRCICRHPIIPKPENVITKAAIALHNFLRTVDSSVYCSAGFTDAEDGGGNIIQGAWRSDSREDTGLDRIRQVCRIT